MPPATDQQPVSALEELRDDPSSRKRFLRAMGGGAAAATLGIALAACGKKKAGGNEIGGAGVATAKFGQGDAGILNFALSLEYLEVDFYRLAVASGTLTGRPLELAKRFGREERDHVTTLTGTVRDLGATPAPKPKVTLALDSRDATLSLMYQLENLGAAAYLAQADRIQSKQVLAAALAIHSVEARHAAVVATLRGQQISPDGAFARGATSVDVLQSIQPFVSG